MEYLNIFVIIVFILLFYIYGLGLSKIIDYIFPDIDTKHDYIIIVETLQCILLVVNSLYSISKLI